MRYSWSDGYLWVCSRPFQALFRTFSPFPTLSRASPLKFAVHLHIYAYYNAQALFRTFSPFPALSRALPLKFAVHLQIYVYCKAQVGRPTWHISTSTHALPLKCVVHRCTYTCIIRVIYVCLTRGSLGAALLYLHKYPLVGL